MNKSKPSVAFCAKNNLCTGCGVCSDVCLNHAISIEKVNGLNKPVVDAAKCKNDKGCSRCFDVCPGQGIDLKKRNHDLFDNNEASKDEKIGLYQECFIAHSCDEEIRYHAASGGCTSTFLIYLLEQGYINGAVVTRFSTEDPFNPEPFIATTKEEILQAKSSKYIPVSMSGIAAKVKAFDGKVAIVGIPCHIQGFRKLASLDKNFSEKIFAYIGLFCSSYNDDRSIDHICKMHSINKHQVSAFTFRDEGCMGVLKATYKDGSVCRVPYSKYKAPLRSFYKPERCLSCIDHFAKLADLSFGDISVLPYSNDKIGSNSVVVRSNDIDKIFNESLTQNRISAQKVDVSEIKRGQVILPYRVKVYFANNFIRRMIRKPVVQYDEAPEGKFHLAYLKTFFAYKVQKILSFFWR